MKTLRQLYATVMIAGTFGVSCLCILKVACEVEEQNVHQMGWSSDGKHIGVVVGDIWPQKVYIFDLPPNGRSEKGFRQVPLQAVTKDVKFPVVNLGVYSFTLWGPSEDQITVSKFPNDLAVINFDGDLVKEIPTEGLADEWEWSPQSKYLAIRHGSLERRKLSILSQTGELVYQRTGGVSVASPRWSPDGEWLACLTLTAWTTPDHKALHADLTVIHVPTKKQEVLVRGEAAPADIKWSSDGKKIAFVAIGAKHQYAPLVGVVDLKSREVKYAFPLSPRPKGIVRWYWERMDWDPTLSVCAVGVKDETRTCVYEGNIATGELKPLTRGQEDWFPRFSPDGSMIAFLRGDREMYLLNRSSGVESKAFSIPR